MLVAITEYTENTKGLIHDKLTQLDQLFKAAPAKH